MIDSDLFLFVSMDLFQVFQLPFKYRILVPMSLDALWHLGESGEYVVVITN